MLHTLCYTLYAKHCMVNTLCYTLYVAHCMLYTVCYTMCVTHCMLHTVFYTLHVTHCMLPTVCMRFASTVQCEKSKTVQIKALLYEFIMSMVLLRISNWVIGNEVV